MRPSNDPFLIPRHGPGSRRETGSVNGPQSKTTPLASQRLRVLVASAAAMAALGFMLGCDEKRVPPPMVVRDSSGITVVENAGPTWEEGEEWRVSPEPVVSIGGLGAPELYQFFDVRGVVVLSSGEVVVADFSSNQIRWFDSDGQLVRTVGREGGGPDEFKAILGMWLMPGDSLAVMDYGNARMKVLGPQGDLGRLYRPTWDGSLARPMGIFADGSFLAVMYRGGGENREETAGVYRARAHFRPWTPSGELTGAVVDRPGAVRFRGTVAGRHIEATPPYTNPTGFVVAAGVDSWWYSSLDRYEIEQYSLDGRLVRLIRRDLPRKPVTPELAEEWRDYARERFADLPTIFREWRVNLPLPELLPAHGDLVLDMEGNLWVAEYSLRGEPEDWSVFDNTGRFLGTVRIPPGGTVTQIGMDYVAGVWTVKLDVEEVRVYHLARGG